MITIRPSPPSRNPITGEGIDSDDLLIRRGKRMFRNIVDLSTQDKQEGIRPSFIRCNPITGDGYDDPAHLSAICRILFSTIVRRNPITGDGLSDATGEHSKGIRTYARASAKEYNPITGAGVPNVNECKGIRVPDRPSAAEQNPITGKGVSLKRMSDLKGVRCGSYFSAVVRNPITGVGMYEGDLSVGKRENQQNAPIDHNGIASQSMKQEGRSKAKGLRTFPISGRNASPLEGAASAASLMKKSVVQIPKRDPISGVGMPLSFDCFPILRWPVVELTKLPAGELMLKSDKAAENSEDDSTPKTSCASCPTTIRPCPKLNLGFLSGNRTAE